MEKIFIPKLYKFSEKFEFLKRTIVAATSFEFTIYGMRSIIIIYLAVSLGLNAVAGTDNIVDTNNPYTAIASRNIFNLSAPLPVVETAPPDGPLPKIKLEGITSILGGWEVLCKADEVNPAGALVEEQSYILKENEVKDGIKVVSIDPVVGVVTFVNHGTVQEIVLPNNTKLPVYMPETPYEETLPKSYPPEFIRARTPDYLGGGPGGISNGEPITNLEDRITVIEAQRAGMKDNNDPAADSLPPTAATPDDAYSSNGSNHTSQQK
jgi:hypothetical protein